MKKAAVVQTLLSLAACALWLASPCRAQAAPDKQDLLRQARQAYYSLRDRGLEAFQCSIRPNWEVLLEEQRKADARKADAAIKTLNQLRFTLTLAADDTVKLTHNELSGQNQQMNKGLEQIFSGMEQTTSGFFATWKVFALRPPLPALDSDYQLRDLGQLYRLSYRESDSDVTTTMTKDFAITDLNIATPQFVSSIRPHFAKQPEGWLINAYEASYRSAKPGEATELKVTIDYQPVNGLQTIQKLGVGGSYGGSSFSLELAFSDCQVIKHH